MSPTKFELETDQCLVFSRMTNPSNAEDRQWGVMPWVPHRRDEQGSAEDIVEISPLNTSEKVPATPPGMRYKA